MTWQQILTDLVVVGVSLLTKWSNAAKHRQLRQTLNRQLTTHRALIGVLIRDILSDYGFEASPPAAPPTVPAPDVSRETGPAVLR